MEHLEIGFTAATWAIAACGLEIASMAERDTIFFKGQAKTPYLSLYPYPFIKLLAQQKLN